MKIVRTLVLSSIFFTLSGIISAQIGVIEARPEEKIDFHCQLYISRDLVLTFSLNVKITPVLNIINFTDREQTLDASRMTFHLDDDRKVQPTLLRISTGIPGDYMFRSYLTIHPLSSFHIEPHGLKKEDVTKIKAVEIQLGSYVYQLSSVRKEVFDVMLERLSQLNIHSKTLRRDMRQLSIPTKGTRVRAAAMD